MYRVGRNAMVAVAGILTVNAFSQVKPGGPPLPPEPPLTFKSSLPVAEEEVRMEPALFFREQWKIGSAQHNVTQADVENPNLELKLYGPSGKQIQLNYDHLWTGSCEFNCAMALRDKNNYVDLTGTGKIRWLTRQDGLQQVHAIIKLADGTWLISEHGDAAGLDLHASEFTLSETRWFPMDMDRVVTHGKWVDKPDLSKVDEIGFTTLMPGSGHGSGGFGDLGWIEVYGRAVPRSGKASNRPGNTECRTTFWRFGLCAQPGQTSSKP